MNYLILTPDGVGSTILQRLITTALYLEKQSVINTHELTNGLTIKNQVAIKDFGLQYEQSLPQIIDILNSSSKNISLVSRVAKYHLDRRQDNLDDQKQFFNFLNSFYQKKIMCVRENIFEYAMSWSIRNESKVLNVYTREDKKKVLDVSQVDENYFLRKCKDYVDYHSWIGKYFPSVEVVSYESMLKSIDRIIEQLTGYKNTFVNNFGVPLTTILKKEYDLFSALVSNKNHALSKQETKALVKYKKTILDLMEKQIIGNSPIKNTTLKDKSKQIRNFKQCLDKFYVFAKNHNWIDQSNATYDFWNNEHLC
tara:strand:+ start:198 stop:1127 length:930 start_codon:yes stop_codon:yes gene_type:complete